MGAQKLKHEALLMEWREKVAECRGSGKGVKEWRRLHQVSLTSYYRWERELLLKAEQQLASSYHRRLWRSGQRFRKHRSH